MKHMKFISEHLMEPEEHKLDMKTFLRIQYFNIREKINFLKLSDFLESKNPKEPVNEENHGNHIQSEP